MDTVIKIPESMPDSPGKLITIDLNGSASVQNLQRPDATADRYQSVVGGYIQLVPYFNTVLVNGEVRRCIAFCNEEGLLKGLPINERATRMWIDSQKRAGYRPLPEVLPGPIAILIGTDEFLREL